VDSVANQLQNALGLSVGPLSMLQALRGGLTVVMTGMVLAYFYTIRACDPLALGAAALFFYSLLVYVCKEVIVTGSVELENVTHYAQMVYWLEIWLLAVAVFDTPQRRRLALYCVLVAGLMACGSIFYGYLTGTRLLYENQDITASSGLFNTGKGIAGVLVVSGIASAYLLRDRADSLGPVTACVMFAGTFLTYARAGLVALLAALGAILGWAFMFRRDGAVTRWARRLLLWCLLVGTIGYVVVGTADLTARWKDIADPDQAGSGRSVFWKVALDSFWDADLAEQALGRGYVGMCKVIEQGYGMRIHTHNDLLDMLLTGGVLGIVSLLVFWAAMLVRLRSLNAGDAGWGAALAILVGIFAQSILTGQMFDPSTMSVYTIAFVCVTGASNEEYDDDPDLHAYTQYIWREPAGRRSSE
jgi:O-antigen ligase